MQRSVFFFWNRKSARQFHQSWNDAFCKVKNPQRMKKSPSNLDDLYPQRWALFCKFGIS